MITVPVSSAVLVFLIVTVAFVLLMWLFLDRRPRDSEVGPKTKDHVLRCPICTHVYLETSPGEMSRCPKCGSLNTEQESEKVDLKEE